MVNLSIRRQTLEPESSVPFIPQKLCRSRPTNLSTLPSIEVHTAETPPGQPCHNVTPPSIEVHTAETAAGQPCHNASSHGSPMQAGLEHEMGRAALTARIARKRRDAPLPLPLPLVLAPCAQLPESDCLII